MRITDVLVVLGSMRPDLDGIASELVQRRYSACLRIWLRSDPSRWAEVSSPGDVWFALEVDGGFARHILEGEDTPDDVVRQILADLVNLAVNYVASEVEEVKVGRLGLSAIKVTTTDGEVTLKRSLVDNLKRIVGWRPPPR